MPCPYECGVKGAARLMAAATTSSAMDRRRWHRGKLGRGPSNRRCRFSGGIALQRDSQAAPL